MRGSTGCLVPEQSVTWSLNNGCSGGGEVASCPFYCYVITGDVRGLMWGNQALWLQLMAKQNIPAVVKLVSCSDKLWCFVCVGLPLAYGV